MFFLSAPTQRCLEYNLLQALDHLAVDKDHIAMKNCNLKPNGNGILVFGYNKMDFSNSQMVFVDGYNGLWQFGP